MNDAASSPKWVSAAKAMKSRPPIAFVAAFDLGFDAAARHFSARVSNDRDSGRARPIRYFFLQLASGRLAEVSDERRSMRGSSLGLQTSQDGEVEWQDLEQVLHALKVPVREVFLQGGLVWRGRSESPGNARRACGK